MKTTNQTTSDHHDPAWFGAHGMQVSAAYSLRELGYQGRAESQEKPTPHVRWASLPGGSGWVYEGVLEADADGQSRFWTQLEALASDCTGHRLDAVHSVGPGIVTAGAFALPLVDGRLQELLLHTQQEDPTPYLTAMMPIIRAHGVLMRAGDRGAYVQTQDHGELSDPEELDRTIRGDKWTPQTKRVARLWVISVALLLRHVPGVGPTWARAYSARQLGSMTRAWLQMPRGGFTGLSAGTMEQQVLWSIALLAATRDPLSLELVVGELRDEVSKSRPPSWKARALWERIAGSPVAGWIAPARERLEALYGVTLEAP